MTGDVEISVVAATPEAIQRNASIDISFEVESRLVVEPIADGFGGLGMRAEPESAPWVKDYDDEEEDGSQRQERWLRRDLANWRVLLAERQGELVGSAVVASRTEHVDILRGRQDLAALWDIRVDRAHRRSGVGTRLFEAAADWATAAGLVAMQIETQNINVPACRFYQRMGCQLATIDLQAYPGLPGEVRLLWWLDLDGSQAAMTASAG